MTTKVEYMCGVGYWQHNIGDGACGNRCQVFKFASFKDAQKAHADIEKLLAMTEYSREKVNLSQNIETILGLYSVTIVSVSIFKRTTTTVDQDIIDPSKYQE